MTISRRTLLASATAAGAAPLARARAQTPTIKIGVLNDLSGPYINTTGVNSVVCAKQAVEEFAAQKGLNVEVISADHQNKPDLAVSIARQWFDNDGVDVLLDVPSSGVALALQPVVREKNKVYLNISAASSALTGEQCSPNFVHWIFDTYMLSRSTGGAMVMDGGDTWYFITADYAFGRQLEADTTAVIQKAGGKVLGSARYPFPGTTDFAPYLAQARASGAIVLGLANAGADTINVIKQAAQTGLIEKMEPAAMLMFIDDVHAVGLAVAQGLNLTESFYWDMNEGTRAFTKRVLPKLPKNYPNSVHAGCYSATLHYLKAVADMGAAAAKKDGVAAVERMKAKPVEDDAFGTSKIRADGRNMVPAYLFEVKKPSDSKGPWDYYHLRATTRGEEAYRPLADGHCPFIKA